MSVVLRAVRWILACGSAGVWLPAPGRLWARGVLLVVLPLLLTAPLPWPLRSGPVAALELSVASAPGLTTRSYRCAGEPLEVELLPGPVDALDIPNTLAGTLPGASLVLRWQGIQRPLPRTNNAGAPSYSDGQWFWQEDGVDHARLLLRRPGGDRQELSCEAVG